MLDSHSSYPVIKAGHIEQPVSGFIVSFLHTGKQKFVHVLSQTEPGALRVAEYHYFLNGSNFQVIACQLPEPKVVPVDDTPDGFELNWFVYAYDASGNKKIKTWCLPGSKVQWKRNGYLGHYTGIILDFKEKKILVSSDQYEKNTWISKRAIAKVLESGS